MLHLLTNTMSKGDIPMTRVKMNAKHEYEFIANFKILQTAFRQHKIDKARFLKKLHIVSYDTNATLNINSPFRLKS